MPVAYRIIRFEGSEDAILRQMKNSIVNEIKIEMVDLTVCIKDRLDDPCEEGFWDTCKPCLVDGFITQAQFDSLRKSKGYETEEERVDRLLKDLSI